MNKIKLNADYFVNLAKQKIFSKNKKPIIAVVCPYEEHTINSLAKIQKEDLLNVILIGDKSLIDKSILKSEFKLIETSIIHIEGKNQEEISKKSAEKCMQLIKEKKADFLMKGLIDTSLLLKTLLKDQYGLKTGRIFSHVGVMFNENYDKYYIISDAGMNIAPNLNEKKSIIENSVKLAHALGNKNPKVALLCAKEKLYDKMPCTIDAVNLQKMNIEEEILGCTLSGPLQIDNAIDILSAKVKNVQDPVAGKADILIMPNIESGNIMGKALIYLGGWEFAGIIEGAKIPIVLTSRSSTESDQIASIALAIMRI